MAGHLWVPHDEYTTLLSQSQSIMCPNYLVVNRKGLCFGFYLSNISKCQVVYKLSLSWPSDLNNQLVIICSLNSKTTY